MTNISIQWTKYSNFFDLWRAHKADTQLVYVIGDNSSCYIGCIGINDGKGGLGKRYQWQYVQKSLAIFNRKEADGQVSYAATFKSPSSINGTLIGAAESLIQDAFIQKHGIQNALFKPVNVKSGYKIMHAGTKPSFL